MPAHPHRFALDKGGPAAVARPLNCFTCGFMHDAKIVAVHDDTRKAVTLRAVGDMLDLHLARQWRGVGILIVLADEHDGQLKHRRPVQRFVRQAFAAAAVAEERHRHARFTFELESVGDADSDGHRGGQRADEADDVFAEVADAVHVRIAPPTNTRHAPQHLRHELACRMPAHQICAEVTVHGRDHVVGRERERRADADRFVTELRKLSTCNFALLENLNDAIIERPRKFHPIQSAEQKVGRAIHRRFTFSIFSTHIIPCASHGWLIAKRIACCYNRAWRLRCKT